MKICIIVVLCLFTLFTLMANPVFAASVVLDYDEYVQLITNVDLLKRKLANTDQQLTLHVKLKDESEKVIVLQEQEIGELKGIIKDHEAAGKSRDELIAALEQRYQQHARTDLYQSVGIGVLAVALFVMAWIK